MGDWSIIAEVVFFASLAMVGYAYVGYPILVYILSRLFPRIVRQADITPPVSVVIAAYNEELDIGAKIENTLALDYPKEKLEIIVASDCSTDLTDDIVRELRRLGGDPAPAPGTARQDRRAEPCGQDRRRAKCCVFSDATTMYERDALRKIVRSFADAEVGCVAGQLVYVDRS